MIEKNMKSRHVQKHATESEWLKANIFIPKQAEIIVYDVDENHTYERFKIGDGVTLLADLPFSNENNGVKDAYTKEEVDTFLEQKQNKLYLYNENIFPQIFSQEDGFSKFLFGPRGLSIQYNSDSDSRGFIQFYNSGGSNWIDTNIANGTITFRHAINDGAVYTDEYTKTFAFIEDIPKIVPLTQSEYDALPTKDETTIYIIKE